MAQRGPGEAAAVPAGTAISPYRGGGEPSEAKGTGLASRLPVPSDISGALEKEERFLGREDGRGRAHSYTPGHFDAGVERIVCRLQRLLRANSTSEHVSALIAAYAKGMEWDAPLLRGRDHVRMAMYLSETFGQLDLDPELVQVVCLPDVSSHLEISGTMEFRPRRSLWVRPTLLLPKRVPVKLVFKMRVTGTLDDGQVQCLATSHEQLLAARAHHIFARRADGAGAVQELSAAPQCLTGHAARVSCLHHGPGDHVYSADFNGVIKVWQLDPDGTWRSQHTTQLKHKVTSIVARGSLILAACGADAVVLDGHTHDVIKKVPWQDFGRVTCVEGMEDNTTMFMGAENGAVMQQDLRSSSSSSSSFTWQFGHWHASMFSLAARGTDPLLVCKDVPPGFQYPSKLHQKLHGNGWGSTCVDIAQRRVVAGAGDRRVNLWDFRPAPAEVPAAPGVGAAAAGGSGSAKGKRRRQPQQVAGGGTV